jgi:hypothetical protein
MVRLCGGSSPSLATPPGEGPRSHLGPCHGGLEALCSLGIGDHPSLFPLEGWSARDGWWALWGLVPLACGASMLCTAFAQVRCFCEHPTRF